MATCVLLSVNVIFRSHYTLTRSHHHLHLLASLSLSLMLHKIVYFFAFMHSFVHTYVTHIRTYKQTYMYTHTYTHKKSIENYQWNCSIWYVKIISKSCSELSKEIKSSPAKKCCTALSFFLFPLFFC